MHRKLWIPAALLLVLASPQAWSHPQPDSRVSSAEARNLTTVVCTRNHFAAADLRLTSEWMARSYEIPARVPEEMLLAGHSYGDTLIALALMAKGASLNELLADRAYDRWEDIAKKVEIDPGTLPDPIKNLLSFGHNELPPRQVLHFLPDVYVGQARDLTINAFTPVVPDQTLVKRFNLSGAEVANIRRALSDPFGVPDKLFLETGGKGGLHVGDWVLAGALAHHKPFSMDTLLAARTGEPLSWSELCLAFGMRPDVLTKGPLSGIYPILTGYAQGTVLVARRRLDFPHTRPSYQDVAHLTDPENQALYPLLLRAYRVENEEERVLQGENLDMVEKGIGLGLARLAHADVASIFALHRSGQTWTAIVNRYAIDMTGQDGILSAIAVREGQPW